MSPVALRRLLVTVTTLAVSGAALSVPAAQALSSTYPGPGVVHAWGDNEYGETQVPTSLTGEDVVAVSAGYEHTLALTADGKVTAWGLNDYGQSTVPSSLDNQRVTAVEAGNRTSFALASDGRLVAWGYGWVPPSLDGKEVTAVASDGPTAALTSDGHVTMWNDHQEFPVPTAVASETFTDVDTSSGTEFFGVTTAGKVMAWDLFGRPQTPVPTALADKVVTKVAASSGTATALTAAGQVIAWNFTSIYDPFPFNSGQSNVPAELAAKTVVDIAAGQYHSLALTSDGHVYAWGTNIEGATEVPADLGRVTAIAASWYGSLAITHDPITVTGAPVVTGTPRVGQTLTADTTGVSSTPTSTTSGQWLRDGVAIADATDATYELTNADAGTTVTYRTTLSSPGFTDVPVDSNSLGPVTGGHITLPTPVVTGTPVVGQPLTVSLPTSGTALTPVDAQVTFTWRRDATVVGTGDTFTPTADDAGHTLHATATATRANFDDATATVETGTVTPAPHPTTPAPGTAPAAAPVVTLHVARTGLRRGQTTTLTWTASDADTVLASGSWSGAQPTHGSGNVRPIALGAHSYVLTATNEHGTTTARVTVDVTRQAKRLSLHVPAGIRLAGERVPVAGGGLDAGEAWTLKLGRTTLATGMASPEGTFARTVSLPGSVRQGRRHLTLLGSARDRTASADARVVTKRGLTLHLAKRDVRASESQTVTVTGLAPGERVTVSYQGKRVSVRGAHATATGRYRVTFQVDTVWGAKTVTAVGGFAARHDAGTFRVVRRCVGVPTCA